MLADDRTLYDILSSSLAVLALGWLVFALVRLAARRRPGLELARPLAAAAATRLAVAGLVSAVPALRSVRGPDEASFLRMAHAFAADPSSLGAMPRALVGNVQVVYMGAEQWLLRPTSDFPLRVGHIALALIAIAVVSLAVTDLAGVRAGRLSTWILAFEPTNVFFSGILHKEAPMLLGEALVLLGAVRMWQRRDRTAVALMLAGLVIACFTRPYAGVALAAACGIVCAVASLRRLGPARRRAPRLALALGLAVGAATFAAPAPGIVLDSVQQSQNANATDHSNLALGPVDVSSATSAARNIGPRVSAVLLRPYPWQVANTSQRLGVIGTTAAWTLLLVALSLAVTRLGPALRRLWPLLFVFATLTAVYALSSGNAGTSFRYRTHLLVGLAAAVAVLVCTPRSEPERAVA